MTKCCVCCDGLAVSIKLLQVTLHNLVKSLETNSSLKTIRKCQKRYACVKYSVSDLVSMSWDMQKVIILVAKLSYGPLIVSFHFPMTEWAFTSLVTWQELTCFGEGGRRGATTTTPINVKTVSGINMQALISREGMRCIKLGRRCVCQSTLMLSLTKPSSCN